MLYLCVRASTVLEEDGDVALCITQSCLLWLLAQSRNAVTGFFFLFISSLFSQVIIIVLILQQYVNE